jgi:hypothetical protein
MCDPLDPSQDLHDLVPGCFDHERIGEPCERLSRRLIRCTDAARSNNTSLLSRPYF